MASLIRWVAALIVSVSAHAAERLQIDVVPVWIYLADAEGEERRAPDLAVNAAAALLHEELAILGVRAYEYNLTVADSERHQTLRCTRPKAGDRGDGPQCVHPHDGPFGPLSRAQIETLPHTMTGIEKRNKPRHRGSIEYFILLAPDDFTWGNALYGVNEWWSWSGWDPADLHWSTTSCRIWSAIWPYLPAHELGHCFGLYHGGSGFDPNFDGSDDSMDLMSQGAHGQVGRLRLSNRERVRHHFRTLTDDDRETKVAPPVLHRWVH